MPSTQKSSQDLLEEVFARLQSKTPSLEELEKIMIEASKIYHYANDAKNEKIAAEREEEIKKITSEIYGNISSGKTHSNNTADRDIKKIESILITHKELSIDKQDTVEAAIRCALAHLNFSVS